MVLFPDSPAPKTTKNTYR